jgi:hypothetical protein
MPGHGFFADFRVPAVHAGKTDKIPVFDLFDDFDVLGLAGPALYAVTFHHDPPIGGIPFEYRLKKRAP